MNKIHLILPMPLSINDYYTERSHNGIVFKSPCKEAKQYMMNVQDILIGELVGKFPEESILKVTGQFFFSHNRTKTDVDNWTKCLFDSLFFVNKVKKVINQVKVVDIKPTSKVMEDDSQIHSTSFHKFFKSDHNFNFGFVDLIIEEIGKPKPIINRELIEYFFNKYPKQFVALKKKR